MRKILPGRGCCLYEPVRGRAYTDHTSKPGFQLEPDSEFASDSMVMQNKSSFYRLKGWQVAYLMGPHVPHSTSLKLTDQNKNLGWEGATNPGSPRPVTKSFCSFHPCQLSYESIWFIIDNFDIPIFAGRKTFNSRNFNENCVEMAKLLRSFK